ncbi:MAG: acetate--CoA ligase family protein [Candidatus Rokuibacteriota bacterium]
MPDLRPLLWPRSVALIGASDNKDIIRGRLLHIMLLRGFPGQIFPVTPSRAEVQGLKAYPSVAALPEPVDLAIIVIPAAAVLPVLNECGVRGIKAAIIITSGFAEETGEAARIRQEELREIATRYDMAICGPNCEGLVNALHPMAATFSPSLENQDYRLVPDVAAGRPISVIAQSGALSFSYLNRGAPRQLRFTYLISSGNEATLEGLDYVDYMLDEERTDIFLLYMEAVRSADTFRKVAAKAACLAKPIIVGKVGRSEAGRRAAASHTGALAGSDHAYDALFRRYGIVRCEDIDQMIDTAAAFAFNPLPRGRRVVVLSASGGGAAWMADMLVAHGLELPELDAETRKEIDPLLPSYASSQNPVDLTAQATREVGYAKVIEILQRSSVVDMVVVVGSLATETLLRRDIGALARVAQASTVPIAFCAYTNASPAAVTLLAEAGIPAYTSMINCAKALRALADYAAFQRRWRGRVEPEREPPAAEIDRRLREAGPVLCEYEAKDLLAAFGVPRPREEMTGDEAAAVAAAGRLGYPVALKVQSPDITHKTEAGAVALAIATETDLRQAYRRVLTSARAAHPGADIRGVLVQQMAPPGIEMIVGVTRDETFGPLLMLGLGGVYVEVLRDVAFAPAPLTPNDARDLLGELRGARLLEGVRGAPPSDVEALVDLLVAVSGFAADHRDTVAEIDLNPVIVHPRGQGLSVVDALIVTAGHRPATPTPSGGRWRGPGRQPRDR